MALPFFIVGISVTKMHPELELTHLVPVVINSWNSSSWQKDYSRMKRQLIINISSKNVIAQRKFWGFFYAQWHLSHEVVGNMYHQSSGNDHH